MAYTSDYILTKEKVNKKEFILTILFLAISGNPIFENEWLFIISAIILAFIVEKKEKTLIFNPLDRWLAFFLTLFVLQFIILTNVSIPADINFLSKILTAAFVAVLLGTKFRAAYFKVMVFIAGISLILWSLGFLIILPGIEVNREISLIVYNYHISLLYGELSRNCGMFWEPGAFQGYIMLVPLLYIGQLKQLWYNYKKECIILLAALFSTMSTTGYAALFLLLFLLSLKNVKNLFLRTIIIIAIVIGTVWAYTSLDFLGKKIEKEYTEVTELDKGEISWSRFGSAMIDMDYIKGHPIVGNGFLLSERYGSLAEYMGGAGNGFTGVMNMLGVPLILLYILSIYRRAPSYSKYERFVFALIVVLLLNGEHYLNYPLFWGLLFVKYPRININIFSNKLSLE